MARGTGTGTKTGTEVRKQEKRGRKKGAEFYTEKTLKKCDRFGASLIPAETSEEKNYNTLLIEHTLKTYEISRNADIKNPESLRACFIEYMKLCSQNGYKIGNIGACSAMGINPRTLAMWHNGDRKNGDIRYKELADFVYSICAMTREQLIADQKINPVIGIFWQRNFDGLRNDTEQQQTINDGDAMDGATASEYMRKYGKLLKE